MVAHSGDPLAPRLGRTTSPQGPLPSPMLQLRQKVMNLLRTMGFQTLGFFDLRIKIRANPMLFIGDFGTNS
jgi:hypothetical protein